MYGSYGKYVSALMLCLLPVAATGCADLRQDFAWIPGIGQRAIYPPDLPTPERRLARLRDAAQRAASPITIKSVTATDDLPRAIREEDDPIVLAQMVRVLGEHPSAAADAELEAALQHADSEVRIAACEAWGRRGSAGAASMLRGVLDGDLNMDVRLTAARELGRIRGPEAVAALAAALEDDDPAMQYQAVLSLEGSTGKDLDGNVQRWRQYVRRELPQPASSVEVAERPW